MHAWIAERSTRRGDPAEVLQRAFIELLADGGCIVAMRATRCTELFASADGGG